MAAIREQRLELAGFGTRALQLDPSDHSAGPPMLLLHGFSDSADTWRPVLGILARRGRGGLAVDLPGFGQADRLDREAKVLPQLDRFVSAAIRHASELAGGRDVVVSGNSLGGLAALRAAEDPELPIAGCVPVAPAGLDMATWIAIVEGAPLVRMIMRAPVPLPEVAVREAVGRVYRLLAFADPRGADGAVVTAFTRHVKSRRDVVRMARTARRLRPEIRHPFQLDRVTCPVLVVWGERDRMVFASGADRILAEIPGARLELIPDCGHCPQVECPERLAELLCGFPGVLAEAA